MDSSDNALSALDAIDTVAFKVGLKGYNVDEVDEFLERLSVETRQLKDQLQQQRQQLRQAAERINQLESGRGPAPAPAAPSAAPPSAAPPSAAPPSAAPTPPRLVTAGTGPEQVTAMIAMAQQFIEHAQEEAETRARELTVAAQERAREIVTEARSRAEDEVNRLNGLKQRLSEDVDALARQLETERTRLSTALAEFASWIEASLQVGGPARHLNVAPTPPPAPATPPPAPPRQAMSPAPAPEVEQPTMGQVLNFEQPSRDE
jgi:cell division initiation protein